MTRQPQLSLFEIFDAKASVKNYSAAYAAQLVQDGKGFVRYDGDVQQGPLGNGQPPLRFEDLRGLANKVAELVHDRVSFQAVPGGLRLRINV